MSNRAFEWHHHRFYRIKRHISLFQIIGAALFGLSIWVRTEPGFVDWVNKLEIRVFFIGIYILIAVGIIVMGLSFLGCLSSLMENALALYIFIGSQILGFVLSVVGSAVLLNFSTMQSSLQPMIRDVMTRFVMTSEYPRSSAVLRMIQESVSLFTFCLYDSWYNELPVYRSVVVELTDQMTIWISTSPFHHNAVTQSQEMLSFSGVLTR